MGVGDNNRLHTRAHTHAIGQENEQALQEELRKCEKELKTLREFQSAKHVKTERATPKKEKSESIKEVCVRVLIAPCTPAVVLPMQEKKTDEASQRVQVERDRLCLWGGCTCRATTDWDRISANCDDNAEETGVSDE